jgi:catechol 2,3-dioxygenase-like lactoylglutathione lyase family enzyme
MELVKPTLDVGIIVSDLEKAKTFYEEVLRLKPISPLPLPDGTALTRYTHGTSVIKLREFPNAPKYPAPIRKAIGIRSITLFVDGKPAGAIADPDGNPIELVSAEADGIQVGLTVSDLEASRAFYGKILGFPEEEQSIFTAGQSKIELWEGDGAGLPKHTGNITDAIGFRYFTFMVKDVDAVHEAAKASGATVAVPPFDLGKLARILMLADPDGNWVEFAARQ